MTIVRERYRRWMRLKTVETELQGDRGQGFVRECGTSKPLS